MLSLELPVTWYIVLLCHMGMKRRKEVISTDINRPATCAVYLTLWCTHRGDRCAVLLCAGIYYLQRVSRTPDMPTCVVRLSFGEGEKWFACTNYYTVPGTSVTLVTAVVYRVVLLEEDEWSDGGEVPRSTARREAREARIDRVALLPLAPVILASPELQCFHRCHHSWVRIVLIITPAPRYTRLGSASSSAHGKGVPAVFSVVLPPYCTSLYRRLILSSTVGPSAPPPAFVMVLQVIESSRKGNYEGAPCSPPVMALDVFGARSQAAMRNVNRER